MVSMAKSIMKFQETCHPLPGRWNSKAHPEWMTSGIIPALKHFFQSMERKALNMKKSTVLQAEHGMPMNLAAIG
jgi:hypothetical protein